MFSSARSVTLPLTCDSADMCAALFPTGNVAWLDPGFDAAAGRTIVGTGSRTLTGAGASGTVCVDGIRRAGHIFELMRDQPNQGPPSGEFPFGWAGWIGYESGASAQGFPAVEGSDDSALLLIDRVAVIDHERGMVTLAVADDMLGSWIMAAAEALVGAQGAAKRFMNNHPVLQARPSVRWRHSDDEYRKLIGECQDAIRDGDVYQVCLTNMATGYSDVDPFAVALRLRQTSPSHHAGFLRIGGEHLVSSSPEQFIRVSSDGKIRTEPIKGTRPRGSHPRADEALRSELLSSEKERAENLMIVDLMRNDLTRVCTSGSVSVSRLCVVESYAQVHQLVSTIEGILQPAVSAIDAIAACFPAGSMTGAPKSSAIDLLHRLEGGARGVYSGCFGLWGCDGSINLAMTIRSAHFSDGICHIGSGGGITALSNPDEEIAEVRLKAAAVLRAAGYKP